MPTKPERTDDVVVALDDLEVHYALRGGTFARLFGLDTGTVKAVDGVDLHLHRGEVLGVVGESGSGKTTLGRALLGLVPASRGSITYRPRDEDGVIRERVVSAMSAAEVRRLRTDIQMVFQDPHAALNPSMTIETAVGHPLKIHGIASGAELTKRVAAALERVGLAPAEQFLDKFPADLSGGQKQRAVIARAIILDPDVLVADEPVSMLDMSVRAKILQLMLDLKGDLGLTYVYITHDLATAKFFCDRVAIMYLGRIVEIGPTEEIFADPKHPYTRALLRAIPEPDPARQVPRDLPRGEIPDAASPPLGCAFHPRCLKAVGECGWESRDLRALFEERWTHLEPSVYEQERATLGALDVLDASATRVTVGLAGGAEATHSLLDRVRAEAPDEPFWSGIESLNDTPSGVEVVFRSGVDPRLRSVGDVRVACVLYPEDADNPDRPVGTGNPAAG